MKKSLFLTAFLSAAVLATAASAANGPGRGMRGGERPPFPPLQDIDANEDGAISRDEVIAFQNARFTDMDANADGEVSPDEMRAFGEERREDRRKQMRGAAEDKFAQLDTDGSGALSREEMSQSMQWFDKFDQNGDGVIEKDELPKRGPRRR